MPATPKRAGRTPKPGSRFPSQVLADNLRMIRALRGLSQSEVVGQMSRLGHDWTQTTVSQVELGARHVNIDELCALALTLSVYVGELLSPMISSRLNADIRWLGFRGKAGPPVPPDTNVDVGTAQPLPGGFIADWLSGRSGQTQLMENSEGELHVLTGRMEVVAEAESASVTVTAADATVATTDADEEPQP